MVSPGWIGATGQILFVSERSGGDGSELFIMDSDGSNVQQITHMGGDVSYPVAARTTNTIAFSFTPAGSSARIYTLPCDLDGTSHLACRESALNQVTTSTSETGRDLYPTWSPDGNWLAFHSNGGSQKNYEIYIVRATGGETRPVTNTPPAFNDEPAWQPRS